MKRTIALAAAAAIALLGLGCKSSTGPIYPMTIGSVWNMSVSVLFGTTTASLDTEATGTQTTTALEKATLINGREVTRFKSEITVHSRMPDSTYTTTNYSYTAEVGDTIFSYTDTTDTVGYPVMRSTPAVGQTWSYGSTYATVVGQEDVTVPAGTYKGAWKVKLADTESPSGQMYEWFAGGTGMVKMSGDESVSGFHTSYSAELTSATIK